MPPRIVALAPMPPEKAAYALARYSRSADGIADSLRWVFDHSAEKFWEQFYYQYGHGSIADLGHVVVCFEGISELAAIHVEDEPVWDGQAKSTRYQDLAAAEVALPAEAEGAHEAGFRAAIDRLFAAYRALTPGVEDWVRSENPRPEAMGEKAYERTIRARAFDAVRYVLPLGTPTNVGQVVSIRTLEKQIGHLLAAPYAEVRDVAERLRAACRESPLDIWGELSGSPASAEPLAPTLARYAVENTYWVESTAALAELAARDLDLGAPGPAPLVDLVPDHPVEIELVATLLYRVSQHPYRTILEAVGDWSEARRREVIDAGLRGRTREELRPEFQCGSRFVFDVTMDVGGWRDMHRHRRCVQVRQGFGFAHGYDVPEEIVAAGLERDYRSVLEATTEAARGLPEAAAAYLVPFAQRVRCLFKMDFAEVEYVARLRSGVKGHLAYRTVAWEMREAAAARHPELDRLLEATPPSVRDTLTR